MRKYKQFLCVIALASILLPSLAAKDQMLETQMERRADRGIGVLFPGGYINSEILAEYQTLNGTKYRNNTTYEKRLYLGSKFLKNAVDTKIRLSFRREPLTREVTFEDVNWFNTFTLFDTGAFAFKARMRNIFPTSDISTRTRTVVSGNLTGFSQLNGRAGSFVPGFSLWASNEIFQTKKYGTRKVASSDRASLVRPTHHEVRVEVEHPVDLDLESGVIVDYTHPRIPDLFVEMNLFDQRRWYSNGKYERWYYSELFVRYDFNKRSFMYSYNRFMFDKEFSLQGVDFERKAEDRGAILTRLALGLQF